MTPTPREQRPTLRRAQTAASVSALALTSTLVLASTVGSLAQTTEAQAVDAETVSVDGTISWSEGGFARTTSNSLTNHADPASPDNATIVRTNATSTADPLVEGRAGTWGDEAPSDEAPGDVAQGDAALADAALADAPGVSTFEVRTLGDRPGTAVNYCLQSALPGAIAETHDECPPDGPEYSHESQSRAKAWGRSGGVAISAPGSDQPSVFVEAENVRTMVECSPSGESWALVSEPEAPSGNRGVGVAAVPAGSPEVPLLAAFTAVEPEPNSRVTAWVPLFDDAPTSTVPVSTTTPPEPTSPPEPTTPPEPPAAPEPHTESAPTTDASPFARVSVTSRAHAVEGYALSDLFATVDRYDSSGRYAGSFTVVFARSECGVKLGTMDHLPLAADFATPDAPAYPADPAAEPVAITAAPVPDAAGIESVRSPRVSTRTSLVEGSHDDPAPSSTVASRVRRGETGMSTSTPTSARPGATRIAPSVSESSGVRGTSAAASPEVTGTSTRRTTTTTTTTTPSPSNSTSMPPTREPDLAPTGPSTTATPPLVSTVRPPTLSTSTPAPTATSTPSPSSDTVIEPTRLRASAETELAGTVMVAGEDCVVVVVGTDLPFDTRHGVAAMADWLDGGNPGDTWVMFVSDDPDGDGWRWAAVSRRTGTTLYVP